MTTPNTTPTLQLKPDLPRTAARFAAWWRGQVLDRPPITLPPLPRAGCATAPVEPPSEPADLRRHWLDVEARVDDAIARLTACHYPADNLPVLMPNIGPELAATLYGCELEFGPVTSWSVPLVHELADWQRVLEREPDFSNVYWQTIERMLERALQRNDGRYLVGLPDLHGNYDILAALRDPQQLCLDLVDDPELIRHVADHVADGYNHAFARCVELLAPQGPCSSTWTPFFHDGPAYLPSCDFWCMVSPQQGRELIWPSIFKEMQPLQRSLFHLDGPMALRHLDTLLACPSLDAVQWTYGAGQGPGSRWLDVYARIRAAGKSVQAYATDIDDAVAILRATGPAGLWLSCGSLHPCRTHDEALARLQEAAAVGGVR